MQIAQNTTDVELVDYAQNIVSRLKLTVDTNSALSNISEWLCSYTKFDADTFYSFKDHEFQIEIVNDINARGCVQKCSQVGATEFTVRKSLAITAISVNTNSIFGMPTSKMVSKTSTSRIKPIIAASPMLYQMQNRDAKGSELLGLGSSFLHLAGTTGAATGAISVPAKYVDIDELDFCDQEVVELFESRLKHAPEDVYGRKGHLWYYSTPTVEDYGINLKFKGSNQKHYQVNCSCCESMSESLSSVVSEDAPEVVSSWFEPDYFRDLVIPGYEGKLIDLTPEMIESGEVNVTGSFMRCPKCMSDVWDDLCDPKRRKWVARFPEKIMSGYQIHPWDAPKVNSIQSIFMAMLTYKKNIANYYNFIIGLPFSDKNNSFLLAPFESGVYSRWVVKKLEGDLSRYCIGVDVGRTAHIAVGKKDSSGKLHVVYLEQFKSSKEELLGERIVQISNLFKARSHVIDAMPDFSAPQYVSKKFQSKIVLACEYTKSKPKGKMSNVTVDAEKNLISAYRTGVLTDYLHLHNSGDVLYPNSHEATAIKHEIEEIKMNLKNLKKVIKQDNEGVDAEVFVKLGPDHYGHAISYLNMACDALGESSAIIGAVAAPAGIKLFSTQGNSAAALPVAGALSNGGQFYGRGR